MGGTRTWGSIVGFAGVLAACATAAIPPRSAPPSAPVPLARAAPLSPQALRSHIAVLASDAFEGRAPASAGEQKTLDYLIAEFKAAGLEPGYQGQWLQPVPLLASTVANAPGLAVRGPDGEQIYAYGQDQVVWSKREAARVALQDRELVFVGYGVVAPERNWNDYAGQSMRGKIAVILVNDPDYQDAAGPFDGKAMTYYGRWTYKFEEAARQGAAGALIIHETAAAAYPWAVVQSSWTGPQYAEKRPDRGRSLVGLEGWLSTETAETLLRRAGRDLATLQAAARQPGFRPVPLGLTASIELVNTLQETVSHNVIGVLPGRERPQEVVLYGAHWDHIGRCPAVDGDDICNGAVDNATGVAGLIELARAQVAAGPASRSLGFIAFTAEERGLLGSARYVSDPAYPIGSTVAMLNMDGLPVHGRSRSMAVMGFGKSTLDDLLAQALQAQGRGIVADAYPERGGFYRSDHFNFAKAGTPVLFARGDADLIEGGEARGGALQAAYVAQRYHKPDDEMQPDWDLSGASEDVSALFQVGRSLAQSQEWPAWNPAAEFRRPTLSE